MPPDRSILFCFGEEFALRFLIPWVGVDGERLQCASDPFFGLDRGNHDTTVSGVSLKIGFLQETKRACRPSTAVWNRPRAGSKPCPATMTSLSRM
jgi:hypothetical protein